MRKINAFFYFFFFVFFIIIFSAPLVFGVDCDPGQNCSGNCSPNNGCVHCTNSGCAKYRDGSCGRYCNSSCTGGESCTGECGPCGNPYSCKPTPTEPPRRCSNNFCTNRSCDNPKCENREVACPGGNNECRDGRDDDCRPDNCGPTNTPSPTRTPTPPPPTNTPLPTATPTPKPTAVIVTGYPTTAPRDTGFGAGKTWTCINPVNPQPPGLPQGEFELLATNFPSQSGTPIYIVGCILEKDGAVSKGFKCTTGDTAVDQTLRIQKSADHTFAIIRPPFNPPTPPLTVPASKEFTARVKSNVPYTTFHTFYGVYDTTLFDPGGEGALHYGTFDWQQNFAKCTPILWDPYGRVFDSQSLEPMPNIQVKLLDQNKNLLMFTGTSNPAITDKTGSFNFYVGKGTYYLEPIVPTGYLFTSNPKLNKNYHQVYVNIYKPDEKIIETISKPEERDIPLDPGNNPPYKTNLTQISFEALPVSGIDKTKVIGQVSHPFTLVAIYQNNEKLAGVRADKYGYFEVNIDNNKMLAGIPLSPRYTKVDLTKDEVLGASITGNNLLSKIVAFINIVKNKLTDTNNSQQVVLGASINPPPRYIEGYIYDNDGNLLINTKVETLLFMSNQSYFETQTDNNGLLIIRSHSLPIFDYYFKVTPINKNSFTLTTHEFINKNSQYLDENRINLMLEK